MILLNGLPEQTQLPSRQVLKTGDLTNYGNRSFPRSPLLDSQLLCQRLPFSIHHGAGLRVHHNFIRPWTPKTLGRPLTGGVDAHLRSVVCEARGVVERIDWAHRELDVALGIN